MFHGLPGALRRDAFTSIIHHGFKLVVEQLPSDLKRVDGKPKPHVIMTS